MTTTLRDLDRVRRAHAELASGRAKQQRLRAGWSQRAVGEFCGVGQAAVCAWESGRRAPRGSAAIRLGTLLERLDRPATRKGA